MLDIAPRSAFAVATRERCLWGEVRSLALNGLPAEDAVLLLERRSSVRSMRPERSAAASLCAALGGHPLRILQAAALIRERGISLDGWTRDITPEGLITELLASLDEKQRRALLALTALPGVPLKCSTSRASPTSRISSRRCGRSSAAASWSAASRGIGSRTASPIGSAARRI